MSFERYDIYFSGKILDDRDAAEVRRRIGKMFKVDDAKLDHLFSGVPVPVKKDVDMDTAVKYRVAFRDAGALVDIKKAAPSAQAAPSPRSAVHTAGAATAGEQFANVEAPSDMTLAPARTGSLEDCAPVIAAAEIPDVSNYQLAPPGESLTTTSPPPPLDIDTGDMDLYPANSGSLLDCHEEPQPVPIPDVSNLQVLDENEE